MLRRKFLRSMTPSRRNRGTRSQSLQAIAVIRATPLKRIHRTIVRDPNMPHLRMRRTVNHVASRDGAATDAGSDSQIKRIRHIPRRAPASLSQRRRIHIGIESNGNPKGRANRSRQVKITPRNLRCGCYVAPCRRRLSVQIGPKDPIPTAESFPPGLAQKRNNRANRRRRFAGGNANGLQIVRPGANAANELCSAGLNCPVQRYPSKTSRPRTQSNPESSRYRAKSPPPR